MNTVERPRPADMAGEQPPDFHDERVERRRAQRLDHVSPQLLPLLRSPGSADALTTDADDDHFGTPILGIVVAVLISIPMWCGVILAAQAIVG